MGLTRKDIERLKAAGKIRGAIIPEKHKNHSGNKPIIIPAKKTKPLIWLEWNLPYWANQKKIELSVEHQFDPARGWRFDFAFPSIKVAVEYEGGIFMGKSGHSNVKGYVRDSEKYNRATVLGWRVIRVTAINYTTALNQLNNLIHGEK